MMVRDPFDKLRVPSPVEPSTPLRLDPARGRGVEGRNHAVALRDRHAEPLGTDTLPRARLGEPPGETGLRVGPVPLHELARPAAFDHLAAERCFVFDFTDRLVVGAYRRLQ